jgi:CPA2 family monovalent cation:H+ antiporter-2
MDDNCFDSRTIIVRPAMPFAGQALAALNVLENDGLRVEAVSRDGRRLENLTPEFVLEPGDELILYGSTEDFVRHAALFRGTDQASAKAGSAESDAPPPNVSRPEVGKTKNGVFKFIDTEKAVQFQPPSDRSLCGHVRQARAVFPSADGCEDCLRAGDSWVHLRICLSCGHTGCCDSSKNKHATKHFEESRHPLIKSVEPGESWGYCYVDEKVYESAPSGD